MKVAFLFPGQGAQYIGMGKDFVGKFGVSKEIYERANEVLGYNIMQLCFEGPESELMKTENTQPAILVTSVAILKVIEEAGVKCDITAGLSLGEYTALVKAKSLSFEDAIKVVKKRGEYMQNTVPLGKGGMAAIIGLEKETVTEVISDLSRFGVLEIANYNSPDQLIISGDIDVVKQALKKLIELGAKRSVLLPVSAPFHCSLLKPAGERLGKELEKIKIEPPEIPVVNNIAVKIMKTKDDVLDSLVKQVSNSVYWQQTIEFMINDGVDTFIEIGPGNTLTKFNKKIAQNMDKKIRAYHVENVEDFEFLLKDLS